MSQLPPYPNLITNNQLRLSSNLGKILTRFTNSIDIRRMQDVRPNNLEILKRINAAVDLATLGKHKHSDFTYRIPDEILKLWPTEHRDAVTTLGLSQAGGYLETEDHYVFILVRLPPNPASTYFESVAYYAKKNK